jgi:hypothetical protein
MHVIFFVRETIADGNLQVLCMAYLDVSVPSRLCAMTVP